jgi:hypothetical protein
MQIRGISPAGILGSYGNWRFLPVFMILTAYGVSQQTASPQNSGPATADLTSMDLEQLMDLKVTTASLFSDKLSQAPGIMSVVTSDELRRFGGLTLGEVLDRVPGFTQSSQYFTDRSLIAVGWRSDQNVGRPYSFPHQRTPHAGSDGGRNYFRSPGIFSGRHSGAHRNYSRTRFGALWLERFLRRHKPDYPQGGRERRQHPRSRRSQRRSGFLRALSV